MHLQDIKAVLSKDSGLKPIVSSWKELPLQSRPTEVYSALLRAIAGQQLSTKAAATIFGRFEKMYDGIPKPTQLIATPDEKLREVGFSYQKAKYLKNIAEYFQLPANKSKNWGEMGDEEIISDLSSIKGVGKWTVQMLLMFSLMREDVFPIDDLGIQNGMIGMYGLDSSNKKNLKKEMEKKAEAWRPYRSYACMAIWAWKDNTPK